MLLILSLWSFWAALFPDLRAAIWFSPRQGVLCLICCNSLFPPGLSVTKYMLHIAAGLSSSNQHLIQSIPVSNILLLSPSSHFRKALLHHSVSNPAQSTRSWGITPSWSHPSATLTEAAQDHQRQAQDPGRQDPSAVGPVTGAWDCEISHVNGPILINQSPPWELLPKLSRKKLPCQWCKLQGPLRWDYLGHSNDPMTNTVNTKTEVTNNEKPEKWVGKGLPQM